MNTSSPIRNKIGHRSDGFVVITVLWILGALATFASIYSAYVINTATGFAEHDDRLQAEGLVAAATELTVYRLTASREPRPLHDQFSFVMGHARIDVAYQTESARIDLNAAPKQVLEGLFKTLGAPGGAAELYATRVIGWRTPPGKDNDSEATDYQKARLAYGPRGGKFPHVGELFLLLDLPQALAERALPFVTVFSGMPQLNALEAAPQALAALPGLPPDRVSAFLAQRQALPGNSKVLLPLLGPAQSYATAERSRATRIQVDVRFDKGRVMNFETVILTSETGSEPYYVLSFEDISDRPRFADSTVRAR